MFFLIIDTVTLNTQTNQVQAFHLFQLTHFVFLNQGNTLQISDQILRQELQLSSEHLKHSFQLFWKHMAVSQVYPTSVATDLKHQ